MVPTLLAPRGAVFGATFLLGVALTIVVMFRSNGIVFDDEIGHYLIARGAWDDPLMLLSLWARPLNTAIYALAAPFGFEAARWFSLLLMAGAAVVTWQLGVALSLRRAYLLPFFFWFQPWVAELGFACITEVPFLLILVAAMLCFARDRLTVAGVLIGLLPLVRHEGMGIAAAWGLYALVTRQWRLAAALAAPYALFTVIYALVLGVLPFWLFMAVKPTDEYGSGGWFHFVPLAAAAIGPMLVPALFGTLRLLKSTVGAPVLGTYSLYLVMHVVIYRFGLFASGGYVEFLLPLAPVVALSAVAGLQLIEDELGLRAPSAGKGIRSAAIAGLIVLGALVIVYGARRAEPHRPLAIEVALTDAAQWLRERGLDKRRIEASHVWFYHAMALPAPRPSDLPVSYTTLEKLPEGTLVVWDQKYSERWGRPRAYLENHQSEWRLLGTFGVAEEVRIYERH